MATSWAIWGANSLSRSHGLTPIPPMPVVGVPTGASRGGFVSPWPPPLLLLAAGVWGFELKRTERQIEARVRHNEDANTILRVRLQ